MDIKPELVVEILEVVETSYMALLLQHVELVKRIITEKDDYKKMFLKDQIIVLDEKLLPVKVLLDKVYKL
jgi:hypothetical protein